MFLLRLFGRLPLGLLYIISDIFFLINYYIIAYRKNIVSRNLRIAFPELTKKERLKLRRDFYRNLGDVMVETVKGLYISPEELVKRVTYEGLEIIEQATKDKQNVVLLTAHQANWEWSLQSANIQFPMGVDGIYKPLKNEGFDRLIYQVRTRFGGTLIPKDKVVRNIAEKRGEVRIIGVMGDQRPMIQTPKYWVNLFGVDTAFFPGSDQIPKMTNAITVFIKVVRVKRGYYRNQIIRIGKPPYNKNDRSIIDKYVKTMEDMILEAPSNWLWSHNRWKYSKDEVENLP
jgi:KDO2-lipid IV(A) lauroyltransferase